MDVFMPTERDMVFLRSYARGDTLRQLARELEVTPEYASRLSLRMRTRMGARSASHAVAIGYDLGILPAGDGVS